MNDKSIAYWLLYTLVFAIGAYTVWGLAVWMTHWQGARSSPPVPALDKTEELRQLTGDLVTSVRNVFGDPVPFARVKTAGREILTEGDGSFSMRQLPVGVQELRITAPGYVDYTTRLRIDAGLNRPLIKYDQGLWPDGIGIDFHAFYEERLPEGFRAFLLIGFANGSEEPIYIREFEVYDSRGSELSTLLNTEDGYRRLALMHTAFSLDTHPDALVLRPGGVANIELPPIRLTDTSIWYRLRVVYADRSEYLQDAYRVVDLFAHLQHEPDLNPHLP